MAVIWWAIAYAVAQNRLVRQGEDKHHCIGEGERLRERGGGGNQLSTSPPPRKRSTTGRAQEKTLSHTHTESKTHWRGARSACRGQKGAGVWQRGLWVPPLVGRSTRAQAGPEKKKKKKKEKKKKSLWEREGSGPQVLFPLTALPLLHHHGRMDDFGEAAGGGCPAALHHDWKVRHWSILCVKILFYQFCVCFSFHNDELSVFFPAYTYKCNSVGISWHPYRKPPTSGLSQCSPLFYSPPRWSLPPPHPLIIPALLILILNTGSNLRGKLIVHDQ